MKNIITIFRKEFLDLSRDKRTLRTMLIIPLFLYPVIITGVSKYMGHQSKNAREEGIKIGVIQNGNETIFNTFSTWNQQKMLSLQNDSAQLANAVMQHEVIIPPTFITLRNDTTQIKKLIDEDSVDAVLWFGPGFDTSIKYNRPADYKLFYDSGKNGFKNDMIFGISTAFKNYIVHERFAAMQIDKNILSPFVEITEVNLATEQQQIGEIIGGILPYFFIIFCLLGCMYPGIDMGAGEKERGTLETLLVSSAGRLEIYLGKFFVVALCGFISAIAALAGLVIAVTVNNEIPAEISDALFNVLSPKSIIMILLLMLPLNIFFAAVILSLSIMAKSFKEAQSMVSPLMIFAILPAMIGFLPGVKLDLTTALIPILNVSLGTKGIISGTVETVPLLLTYASLIVLAAIAVIISVRFFNNEKNIARS